MSRIVSLPVEHAAGRADPLFAIEVTGRLDLVDLVFTVLQVIEAVFAVGVGCGRRNDVAVRIAKLDGHARQANLRVVPIAFGAAVSKDAAG